MSTLRESIDQEDWLSSMLLIMRNEMNREKILVLVEGASDISFFNSYRFSDRILYDSPDSGKKEVITAVSQLRDAGKDTVYGICDADFDRLSNINYDGIYYTDAHDLEMMLIEGGVVDKFIMHFTNPNLIQGNDAPPFCLKIKQTILCACYRLGLLKWFNYLNRCDMNFKGMKYRDFVTVTASEISVDEIAYYSHILGRSRNIKINLDVVALQKEIRKLEIMDPDHYAICNGHDFIYLLKMMYDTSVSIRNNMRLDEVDSYLRLSYDLRIFSATRLHTDLNNILIRH